jgi:hypothetical protein
MWCEREPLHSLLVLLMIQASIVVHPLLSAPPNTELKKHQVWMMDIALNDGWKLMF